MIRIGTAQPTTISLNGGGYSGGGLSVANPFEEELKKRMAMAKAQGWSDDEINRSALIERGLARQRSVQAEAQAKQQQAEQTANNIQKKQPSGWKRLGINAGALLASTAAGIGAVAAAPVTGGASLAGGFAAGAGIEALRRKLLGENQSLGASALEGGLTILPGIGKAVGGVRAARAAKLATAATDVAEVARTADKVADATKIVQTAGNATRAVSAAEAADRIAQIDRRIAMANKVGGLQADEARTLLKEKQALQLVPKPNNAAVMDATKRTAEIVPKKQSIISNVKEQFQPNNEGFLFRKGSETRAASRGIEPGASFRGMSGEALGIDQASEINRTVDDTFKQLGIKRPMGAQAQLEKITEARKSIGKQMSDAIVRDNVPFDDAAKTTLGQRLREGLGEIADFDPNNKAHVELFNNYARRVDQAKDMVQLEKERKIFDKAINFNRNSQSVDPIKEQIARVFRNSIDEFATDASPVSKELKTQWRNLKQAEQFMTKKDVLNPKGVRTSLISLGENRGVGGNAIQAGRDATGKVMQSASNILSRPATKMLAKQYGLRLLAGTDSVNPVQPMSEQDTQALMQAQQQQQQGFTPQTAFDNPQNMDEAMLNEVFAGGATDFNSAAQSFADMENQMNGQATPGSDVAGAQTGTTPFGFTRDDLLAAAGQIVNDDTIDNKTKGALLDNIKDLNQLLNDYDTANNEKAKLSGAGGNGGLNVTKVTAQQYGLAQSGQGALENLKSLLQQDPGVLNRSRTPGRGIDLLGIGGTISNAAGTGNFDAIGYNIADSILRLRTGATANESEVRKLQSQIMPRAGDSAQTVQTKLKQIEQIFGGVLNLATSQPSTPDFNDLSSLFGGGDTGFSSNQDPYYGY